MKLQQSLAVLVAGAPLVIYHVNHAVSPGAPEVMAAEYLRAAASTLQLRTASLSDLEHVGTWSKQRPWQHMYRTQWRQDLSLIS